MEGKPSTEARASFHSLQVYLTPCAISLCQSFRMTLPPKTSSVVNPLLLALGAQYSETATPDCRKDGELGCHFTL